MYGRCGLYYWPSWDEDKAKHAEYKVPACQKCGSKNTQPAFMPLAVYAGERCQDCGNMPGARTRNGSDRES